MAIEHLMADGSRARDVLENEVFIRAFDDIEKDLIDQWKSSPARDADGREKLWTYLQMLRRVKANLEQTMTTGRLAEMEANHKRNLPRRLYDAFSDQD